eukprot:s6828_g5.t1
MVYDQSPTYLAFALLPVFATLWSEQVSADGISMKLIVPNTWERYLDEAHRAEYLGEDVYDMDIILQEQLQVQVDRWKEGQSGFRENATMVIAVDARHAMRQGVVFYRSKNGVFLTSDRISPASIIFYESLKDNQKYDRRGKPM